MFFGSYYKPGIQIQADVAKVICSFFVSQSSFSSILLLFNLPIQSFLRTVLCQFFENSCINTISKHTISLLVPNSVEFYYPHWSLCYFGRLPISFTPQHNSPVTLKGHFTVPYYSVTLTDIDFQEYPFKQQAVGFWC